MLVLPETPAHAFAAIHTQERQMSTMPALSPSEPPSRAVLRAVGDARRWIRETPAPRWEGGARNKATFAAYVGASIVTLTVLGLSLSALLGQLLNALG